MAKKQDITTAVDHDDETQMIAERLVFLKAETKWDLPVNRNKALAGAPLQEWLLKKEEEATRSAVERGIGYGLLKRELGHGAYEGWLKDNGIAPRTAQRCMKSAQLLMGMSNSNAPRAALLPQRKLDVLVSLPAVVVDEMFNEGELDNIEHLNREQLQEIVQLRKQLDSEYKKNDRLSERVGQLDEEARQNKALPETALYIKELRRALLEETECLRANSHTMQSIMDRAAMLPEDMTQADWDSIAHPLMYALQGLHATASALYDKGFELCSDFKPDVDVFPPELDKKEVANAKRLMKSFDNEAQLRDKLRQVDLAPTSKKAK